MMSDASSEKTCGSSAATCCASSMSRLQLNNDQKIGDDEQPQQLSSSSSRRRNIVALPKSKGETRGQRGTGLTHECGVFGCIAAGDWPSQIDVPQVICLGKVYIFAK